MATDIEVLGSTPGAISFIFREIVDMDQGPPSFVRITEDVLVPHAK
jgi:hypothetical protein